MEVLQSDINLNYDDPFQDVSLPVFSIHGNHDDPSREGGLGDALAAMDLLAASKLVNYFGKTGKVDDILISPILLKKGPTHIALYGLGAIRDERLHRMWQQKKVKFQRPIDHDNFLNIFVVHQNRDYGRGSKNCLHESMIPEWMGAFFI
jgi:double-strand break repair protein MRE11